MRFGSKILMAMLLLAPAATTYSVGAASASQVMAAKATPKACALLAVTDFAKAGVTIKVGGPEDNPAGALAPGGSACGWRVDTGALQFPFQLSYGRNLKQRPIMQAFADRIEPIKGLATGSVYVETDGNTADDGYNGIVVKRGTLVVTLQATRATIPKASMLQLAKLIDARVK